MYHGENHSWERKNTKVKGKLQILSRLSYETYALETKYDKKLVSKLKILEFFEKSNWVVQNKEKKKTIKIVDCIFTINLRKRVKH